MPPTLTESEVVGAGGTCSKQKICIHWFRHGLRLHDNPALIDALMHCKELYPVYIFHGTRGHGFNQKRFLHEAITDLDNIFKKHGGRLYVFQGDPVKIFTALFEEWDITTLSFEQDPQPIWKERDESVKELCKRKEVDVIERISHTLYDQRKIIENNDNRPPHTFSRLCDILELLGSPDTPVQDPCFDDVRLPVIDNFDEKYAVPTLEELGYVPEEPLQKQRVNVWIGGESRALVLMKERLIEEEEALNAGYAMPNQYKPDLVGPPLSLSPYLSIGCLSIRKLYASILDIYTKIGGTKPHIKALAQLTWREYFYCMSYDNPNFNQMKNNPICLQINWYRDEEQIEKWKMGRTGFPWIDACMNQLRIEGWIHHTCRHAIACFLTRGHLWIHWEEGAKVLDRYLLDADWSLNAGNWMWVSSSAFESALQCPKCFSPVYYGMRMDPTGEFVRRYVPQLKHMPLKHLFMPWKAPIEVQEKAGCIIGKDYPMPMVDHNIASAECDLRMKEVKALYKSSDILHCTPSNSEEVGQFSWIPTQMSGGAKCTANSLCIGIDGL